MLTYQKLRTPGLFSLSVCVAGLLAGAAHFAYSAPAPSADPSGWQTDKNVRLGFAVTRPTGWTVQADSQSILVQSRDRSETVLMQAFTAAPGESAQAHLSRVAQERAALFPDAQVTELAPRPSAGDEVAGTFSYQSPSGPGTGRVLCSIIHGKGLLFALAAPDTAFPAAQPALTRILKSLRFMAPAGAAKPFQNAVRMPQMRYATWSDPREHGFHVEVPQGWKAVGGAFRFGPMDVRIAYQVLSPDKGMTVVVGDPRLPSSFQAPNEQTERIGMRDGTNGLLHFMSAAEFNRWYLGQVGGQEIDNLKIGEEHPLDQLSRQRTAQAQQSAQPGTQVEVSVGMTEFVGRSKLIDKPVTGLILSTTQRMSSRVGAGGGVDSTTWFANPILLVCTDDAAKVRSQQTTVAVLSHLLQTYREYPEWDKKRFEEINQATDEVRRQTGELSRQMIQNSQERTQQIARDSDARRSASMGAYWNHVEAGDEQQRGFVNYLGDRADVTGADGVTHNVQSGSKHYYQGQNGTIVGTNSEYSPGVDFTPLTER